ncbi:TonB-dependent receptor [Acetobacter sp. TBRC 12305]|uniref:TonB-dependent receptor n=2 Tax=Acetobacter garciniae TaxID=2817435 RepID=A0A939HPD8_9PROT|nr:TonB-dependent receptor [Acetobacter garciniae]MBO1325518.1 TonB-dependent receptor [Acetobacter garciniae]MBX0345310.1 TonB-dependent receptor [Acetobacter garciniae]
MSEFTSGTSPFKILATTTPGVNFTTSDALGLDTWANSMYLRGFDQSQIGVTLDGIPLGDQSFLKYNGLDINSAITQDNISAMSLSQGAGALDLPSVTALGGGLRFFSSDPSEKAGGRVSQMFGSYDTYRTYVRADSGALNSTGTKFFVSYARSSTQKWRGAGEQFQQQVNAKLVQPIGQDSKITALFDWSDLSEFSYSDLSLDIINHLGMNIDSYYPNYTAAYKAAQGIYPPGYNTTKSPKDVSYYDAGQVEKDFLGGLNFDFALTSRLRWQSVAYAQSTSEFGTYGNPYVPSPGTGAPLSEQVQNPVTHRYGFTSGLQYAINRHTISSGIWYENVGWTNKRVYYNEPALGQGAPLLTTGPWNTYGPAFAERWGQNFNTNTFQYYLQDVYRVLPNLSFRAGFKSLLVTTAGGGNYNNPVINKEPSIPSGSLTSAAAFLPHFAGNWTFLKNHELYFDISENMRAYTYSSYGKPCVWCAGDQPTFLAEQKKLRPERDWVYQLGYRYTSEFLVASLSLYRVNFYNRLAQLASGNRLDPQNTVSNVGSVTQNGIDAGVTLHPVKHLSIFNSVSYNHSVYDDNITSSNVVYSVKGKKLVGYPSWMYKTSVSYDINDVNMHFDANYVGKRYFSYVNDTSVPAYWVANTGLSYTFRHYRPLKGLKISFNVYNLFNERYISTLGENGFPLSGDLASMFIGAPRQFFGTLDYHF